MLKAIIPKGTSIFHSYIFKSCYLKKYENECENKIKKYKGHQK